LVTLLLLNYHFTGIH